MTETVQMRVLVEDPLPGVVMQIQRGRAELLPPIRQSAARLWFEFEIRVDRSEELNFLGEFAQGPKQKRFVYLNSGEYAKQKDTCWARRAKLSLMTITKAQVKHVLSDQRLLLQGIVPGVGSDGGPICATVKQLEWKVVSK